MNTHAPYERRLDRTVPEPDRPNDAQSAVDALAGEVLAEQSVLAQAKSIDLGLAHAERIRIRGDRESLRVLLSNLVDNAIRYTPEGGRVDAAVALEDGLSVLTVEDTGPGIAPEERSRVFDRFYRAEHTGAGSGLGLAIVQNIAPIISG